MLTSPQLVALRNRMHRIATEKGLHHVSNETVAIMMTAIEEYLKRLLTCTQLGVHGHKPQSTQSIQPTQSIQSTIQSTTQSTPILHSESQLITAQDIHHTITTRPYLLGEDLSVNLERISMLLYHCLFLFPCFGSIDNASTFDVIFSSCCDESINLKTP